MGTLSGLNSIIQLESARLEGQQQTQERTQSQTNNAIQQQGQQTQQRSDLKQQKLEAEYVAAFAKMAQRLSK